MIEEATTFDVSTQHNVMSFLITYPYATCTLRLTISYLTACIYRKNDFVKASKNLGRYKTVFYVYLLFCIKFRTLCLRTGY